MHFQGASLSKGGPNSISLCGKEVEVLIKDWNQGAVELWPQSLAHVHARLVVPEAAEVGTVAKDAAEECSWKGRKWSRCGVQRNEAFCVASGTKCSGLESRFGCCYWQYHIENMTRFPILLLSYLVALLSHSYDSLLFSEPETIFLADGVSGFWAYYRPT